MAPGFYFYSSNSFFILIITNKYFIDANRLSTVSVSGIADFVPQGGDDDYAPAPEAGISFFSFFSF